MFTTTVRASVLITGVVQGVGFRPFIYRLAAGLSLSGFVRNTSGGVEIWVEGDRKTIDAFLERLPKEKPPLSVLESVKVSYGSPEGYLNFSIKVSDRATAPEAVLLPDTATCPACLAELFDPENRRYRYPFTTCTTCGPRYSIAEALPFDRERTTMRDFEMCAQCREEYESPGDRRFHSQTNACPECGPRLRAEDREGRVLESGAGALALAIEAVKAGKIVALKGIGGFQLVLDAGQGDAVALLRERKHRQQKPFALMVESMAAAQQLCEVGPVEKAALSGPAAPIVLLRGKPTSDISPLVVSGLRQYGVMLPYSPLHHLLLRELKHPVVCTSGNISDEPICVTEEDARERLNEVADLFVTHDRGIVRGLDDSVVRVIGGQVTVFRRARGYAPLSVSLSGGSASILAVGGHLKNTIALYKEGKVHLSQHIGNLETAPACELFEREVRALSELYQISPSALACDMHPDYHSTGFAERSGKRLVRVQHHVAHVLGAMAENTLEPPVLGVSFDGTGFGPDHTIWGGEFLAIHGKGEWRRVGHLRTFRLPGGDIAVEEPRRAALGLLFELYGDDLGRKERGRRIEEFLQRAFRTDQLNLLVSALKRGLNAPITSSAGRLFDGVAALAGVRLESFFEGQAAMELEGLAIQSSVYPFTVRESDDGFVLDWEDMLRALLRDTRSPAEISGSFHAGLAEGIAAAARTAGIEQVVLTGGVFQNRLLSESAQSALNAAGFRVWVNHSIPPNDGGISFGQIAAAVRWC